MAAFSGIIALNYGWSSYTTARDLDREGPSHDVGAYRSGRHCDFVVDQLISRLRTVDVS